MRVSRKNRGSERTPPFRPAGAMSAFTDTYGFERHEANLANWRTLPFARFSFQATREFVPTAVISCGMEQQEEPPAGDGSLSGFRVAIAGRETGFGEFLEHSFTDAFVAMKDGAVVSEWSAPHCDPSAPHILFSITKSVTGLAAGILEDDGLLDTAAPVSEYLAEARGSAYGDATVRDLLEIVRDRLFRHKN